MPSLQDIRQFNARLIALGNEPEVVQEWGEELEDVPVPESGLDDDLSSLLSDTGSLDDAPQQEAGVPDFSDLLADADQPQIDPGGAEPDADPDLGPPDESMGAEPDDVDPFAFPDDLDFGPDAVDDSPSPDADEFAAPETLGEPAEDDFAFPEDPFAPADDDEDSFGSLDAAADEFAAPGDDDDPFGTLDAAADEFAAPDDGDDADADEVTAAEEFGSLDEFAAPGDVDADEVPSADQFGSLDEFAAPDQFAAPTDGDDSDDGFDLPEAFEAADDFDSLEEAPDADSADSDDADDFGFDLPDGFSLDDEADSGAAAPDDPGALPTGGDDFSLDDDEFSGFDLSDDDAGSSFDDDTSFDAPSVPGSDDEFALPDTGDDDDGFGSGLDDVGDLDEVGEDDLDEFSLGDFGAEFGVLDESGPSEEDLNPAISIPDAEGTPAEIPTAGSVPGDFALSDGEFQRLQRALSTLPLNLKQYVEEIVAEAKGTTDEVEKLCRMLVDGESATQIATFAGRILGQRIRIPRGYEKASGEDFERERSSFGYQFRENIWPIVRLAGVFTIVAAILGLLGYNFIARPLIARSLYQQGLEFVQAEQYSLGNQTFDRAWQVWENPDWYYDYAEAFTEKRQYSLAEEKYQELLFGRNEELRELANRALTDREYGAIYEWHDPPKRGTLDYARLESEILGNYELADRLINLVLFQDTNDYDARLALGDNYMNRADVDQARFEDARLAYARLIERYGQTDELLFRMLGYFIAVDNLEQVLLLKETFQNDLRAEINPTVYASLAGYLLDQEITDEVEDVIFRALDVDQRIPELHYELARYYREIGARGEEQLALSTAISLLTDAQPFSPDRRAKLIDAHTRLGEDHYRSSRFLEAQESFTRAIDLYDQGRARRVLGADATLARVYSRLGDVLYYVARDFDAALLQYDRAEENGFREPELDYKQGYVHYRNAELEDALAEFRQAADDPSAYTNALIWATANTHFRRQNLFASEAFYRELLDRVERQRDRINTLFLDEDPSHRSVIEYLFRGYNNLGVTLFELSEQTSDPERYSQSLVFFTQSTELAENYQRDPDTLVRTDAVDLAFLNQREALFPRPEFEMQIYNAIPEDLDDLLF